MIREGTATFETLDGPVTVAAGETVRFAPGEYQSDRNDGESDLVALALGAPGDTRETRIPVACPACGRMGLRLASGGRALAFVCPGCDARHVPVPCPGCGHDRLRVTTDDDHAAMVGCRGCGATYDEPLLRD